MCGYTVSCSVKEVRKCVERTQTVFKGNDALSLLKLDFSIILTQPGDYACTQTVGIKTLGSALAQVGQYAHLGF